MTLEMCESSLSSLIWNCYPEINSFILFTLEIMLTTFYISMVLTLISLRKGRYL